MFRNIEVVKMSWLSRIGALLFGKKIVSEDSGVRVHASYWRGVYYILYVTPPNTRLHQTLRRMRREK